MPLPATDIRRQFPVLEQTIGGHPLVYLDWAATGQMPLSVIHRMDAFSRQDRGNVHRGMHILAERSTDAYEDARLAVAKFINAPSPNEIVFTRGCTESINLVARSLADGGVLGAGDAVVISALEHHSNVVPWLQLKHRIGIDVLWIDCDAQGQLDLAQLRRFLSAGSVKLVSITAQSNVLGVRPPLHEIIPLAHDAGALVLVDAAQSVAHHPTDVQAMDCDFLAFSGHKIYGPTGIGVLYAKAKHLRSLPPFLGGGMMIRHVTRETFTAADVPQKFEAGTPPITEAVGLHAAIDWLTQFRWAEIEQHEQSLIATAYTELQSNPRIQILGSQNPLHVSGCISFVVDGAHPHDLTDILGKRGICLRAGHHCAQPLHQALGVQASTRLSIGLPTATSDIQAASASLRQTIGQLD